MTKRKKQSETASVDRQKPKETEGDRTQRSERALGRLKPGTCYRLGDRTVVFVPRMTPVCGENGEVIAQGWSELFYDAARTRVREYDGFSLYWFPETWLEIQGNGELVEVRKTGLTVADLEALDGSGIDEEQRVFEQGRGRLKMTRTGRNQELGIVIEDEFWELRRFGVLPAMAFGKLSEGGLNEKKVEWLHDSVTD